MAIFRNGILSPAESPVGAAIFFVSFVLIGTMIVLNLVIGVIMNSMEESNAEIAIKQEIERRKIKSGSSSRRSS